MTQSYVTDLGHHPVALCLQDPCEFVAMVTGKRGSSPAASAGQESTQVGRADVWALRVSPV